MRRRLPQIVTFGLQVPELDGWFLSPARKPCLPNLQIRKGVTGQNTDADLLREGRSPLRSNAPFLLDYDPCSPEICMDDEPRGPRAVGFPTWQCNKTMTAAIRDLVHDLKMLR